jgi:methyltransferase (TIGR00027 family)
VAAAPTPVAENGANNTHSAPLANSRIKMTPPGGGLEPRRRHQNLLSANLIDGRDDIMREERSAAPDSTAAWVALWRAMHVLVDPPPHVLEDEIGLALAAPEDGWRRRPIMDPHATRLFRAAMVARARFVEDLLLEQVGRGVGQYVILGAGLDTFAQRRPEIASSLRVFEVDQPGAQAWKLRRLIELGFAIPEWLRFVPVDFEAGGCWWELLESVGFDPGQPAVVAATGVSMYLTKGAIVATLRQVAALVPGSTLAMTFLLPLEFAEPEERLAFEVAEKGARAIGTPFISFFTPPQMLALARAAGFRNVQHVSAATLAQRYFAGRADGLRPGSVETLLVAKT